jgi:hypothetical protein
MILSHDITEVIFETISHLQSFIKLSLPILNVRVCVCVCVCFPIKPNYSTHSTEPHVSRFCML